MGQSHRAAMPMKHVKSWHVWRSMFWTDCWTTHSLYNNGRALALELKFETLKWLFSNICAVLQTSILSGRPWPHWDTPPRSNVPKRYRFAPVLLDNSIMVDWPLSPWSLWFIGFLANREFVDDKGKWIVLRVKFVLEEISKDLSVSCLSVICDNVNYKVIFIQSSFLVNQFYRLAHCVIPFLIRNCVQFCFV